MTRQLVPAAGPPQTKTLKLHHHNSCVCLSVFFCFCFFVSVSLQVISGVPMATAAGAAAGRSGSKVGETACGLSLELPPDRERVI